MKDFEDIASVWNLQHTHEVPKASDIIYEAKAIGKKMIRQIMIQIATLVVTVAVIAYIAIAIDFKSVWTYVGCGIVLLTILAFVGIRFYQSQQMRRIDFLKSPITVIGQLETYYKFQQFVATKVMLGYFIWLNVGMILYMVEVMKPMPNWAIVIFLIFYLAWMLFSYYVIGKKQKQKEYANTEAMIKGLRQIQDQLI
jgi:hypothetical protein